MKFTTTDNQLKNIIIEAINHKAPDYFNLKKSNDEYKNDRLQKTGSAFTSTKAPPLTTSLIEKRFQEQSENPTRFANQGIRIIQHTYKDSSKPIYEILVTNNYMQPILLHTHSPNAISPTEFTNIKKSFAKQGIAPVSLDCIMQKALLGNQNKTKKSYTKEQLEELDTLYNNIIWHSTAVDEFFTLYRLYPSSSTYTDNHKENIHSYYSDHTRKLNLIAHSLGIITLKDLINYIDQNAELKNKFHHMLKEKFILIHLILQATQHAHQHNIAHNAISIDNIAIDISREGYIIIFLKHFYFKTDVTTPTAAQQRSRAFSLSALNTALPEYRTGFKQDCDDLVNTIKHIVYQTTKKDEILTYEEKLPQKVEPFIELMNVLQRKPYDINQAIATAAKKFTILQELNQLKKDYTNKRDKSPSDEQCLKTIEAITTNFRKSPNTEEATTKTLHALQKKESTSIEYEDGELRPQTPSFFSLKKTSPLPDGLKKEIEHVVSPKTTNQKKR
jgi:hypothetical protein